MNAGSQSIFKRASDGSLTGAGALQRRGRPLVAGLGLRQFCLITLLFWSYVALSNVLYAHNFGVGLASINMEDPFAPWRQRVLQHLLLLPPLLACFWMSLRLGWQPLWRRLPPQFALGIGFAALPHWFMQIAGLLMKRAAGSDTSHWSAVEKSATEPLFALWVASGTNFLLQYGFGLALVTGFALYQRFRDSELHVAALERESSAARLAALRMQLSPHTLFNLLNTIRGQIGWDPAAAQQLVVQLSDLLRRLLNAGEREFASLADELQFVRLYLQLQQSRFSDRLSVTLPPAEGPPALWVPSLILQPLVENAVVHGLAAHDGPVHIELTATIESDTLTLRIVNTVAAAAAPREAGIGLRNVRERLQVHFGERATLHAGPAAPGLWVAQIQLPAVRS